MVISAYRIIYFLLEPRSARSIFLRLDIIRIGLPSVPSQDSSMPMILMCSKAPQRLQSSLANYHLYDPKRYIQSAVPSISA